MNHCVCFLKTGHQEISSSNQPLKAVSKQVWYISPPGVNDILGSTAPKSQNGTISRLVSEEESQGKMC